MKRLKALNRYQKLLLILMAAMLAVFSVLYAAAARREGIFFGGELLIPEQKDGKTLYSGEIRGTPACFSVDADRTVSFSYGSKTYGPYTVREDPSAVPKSLAGLPEITGAEILLGDRQIFRGAFLSTEMGLELWDETGKSLHEDLLFVASGPNTHTVVTDDRGNRIDPMEPSASRILSLWNGPALSHRGSWGDWILAAGIFLVTALYLIFADDLFRWRMKFTVTNPDRAEPSGWVYVFRYADWTLCALLMAVVLILGLE